MIHRLQETDPRTGSFRRNEEAPLDCDLMVVDEVSMVDVPLMRAMFCVPWRSGRRCCSSAMSISSPP